MTPIAIKYAELVAAGWQLGPAVPVVEVPLPDGQGAMFTFASVAGPVIIYSHPTTGAHEVHGAILTSYLAQGGPLGQLGYPISDEHDDHVRGLVIGKASDFQHGSIFWNAANGHVTSAPVGSPHNVDLELLVGIDVSTFQGVIDWNQVATHGTTEGERVEFAYIKATEGDTGQDAKFATNWAASRGVIARGAYHFFHPRRTADSTRAQADNFIATVTAAGDGAELPPMVDVEALASDVSAAHAAASLQFFLSIVEQGFGKRPVIYTFPSFWTNQMANSEAFHGFHLWIANYGAARHDGGFERRSRGPIVPGKWPAFTIWQNAVKPGVAGIAGLVDRDLAMIPTGVGLGAWLAQIPQP